MTFLALFLAGLAALVVYWMGYRDGIDDARRIVREFAELPEAPPERQSNKEGAD